MAAHQVSSAQTYTNNNRQIRSVRQVIRAGVELLAHDIQAGHPEVLSECLKAMARFFFLSLGNVLLISTQRPQAQQVAGFRAWNELGRRVKQGEKGIMIFAPILSEPKPLANTEQADAQPNQQLLGFRPVRVWDIDQTEGEPAAINSTLSPDLADVLKKLMELAASQEIQIQYSEKIAPAKGTSYRGIIRLLPDLQAEETILVLVQELALQMLYQIERRSFVTRDVLLREATAVVFVVSHALSLTSESDHPIELYQGNVSLFSESLEVVKRVASIILGAISPRDDQQGGN